MRQRNAGAHPLTVMADPPREVAPGEVIDFDELLAGFEPADDNDGDTEQSSDQAPPKTRKSKAAPSAESTEEVSP